MLVSCGARKVDIDKKDITTKADSTSVVKKDETTVTNNNIVVDTNVDEVEVTPIDTTKPVIIGDKKYYNAKIRYKKTKTKVIDTTKSVSKIKETNDVRVVKNKREKVLDKKVDKKFDYSIFFWLIIFLIILYVSRRVTRIFF
jgi:hypothetical protein